MSEPLPPEVFISVDVETAGPYPSQYSLLTIGACTIADRPQSFYVELKPVNDKITPEAFAVHHLDLKWLNERGAPPAKALADFEDWLRTVAPPPSRPVFVAFNAAFDWMFVNDYFYRFLGRNPFGHSALDIKSLYMGLSGSSWAETSLPHLIQRYLNQGEITHHALRDALDQALIFRKIIEEARQRA